MQGVFFCCITSKRSRCYARMEESLWCHTGQLYLKWEETICGTHRWAGFFGAHTRITQLFTWHDQKSLGDTFASVFTVLKRRMMPSGYLGSDVQGFFWNILLYDVLSWNTRQRYLALFTASCGTTPLFFTKYICWVFVPECRWGSMLLVGILGVIGVIKWASEWHLVKLLHFDSWPVSLRTHLTQRNGLKMETKRSC